MAIISAKYKGNNISLRLKLGNNNSQDNVKMAQNMPKNWAFHLKHRAITSALNNLAIRSATNLDKTSVKTQYWLNICH